jgi:hypothetical protein
MSITITSPGPGCLGEHGFLQGVGHGYRPPAVPAVPAVQAVQAVQAVPHEGEGSRAVLQEEDDRPGQGYPADSLGKEEAPGSEQILKEENLLFVNIILVILSQLL